MRQCFLTVTYLEIIIKEVIKQMLILKTHKQT